jgi:biopolymer transport protein ExbD
MGLFKKTEEEKKGMHEINMTPLIDVSLVLVVMLLLATPLAFESSIAVRKSHASARTADNSEKDERIELRILSDTEVKINRITVVRDELMDKLKPLLENSTHRRVIVECGDNVSHGAFVDVLDRVKLSGAADIALTGS